MLVWKIDKFCMQNETNQGHEIRCRLKQGSKMSIFLLIQGQLSPVSHLEGQQMVLRKLCIQSTLSDKS